MSSHSPFGGVKVIDVDAHYSEPADLWTSRAPHNMKDRLPQIRVVDGVRTWSVEGKPMGLRCASSAIDKQGVRRFALDVVSMQLEDVHPSSYDGKERVKILDEAGIWAQILYPNLLGFGGSSMTIADPELRLLTTQIYNDAMAQMQEESGNRLLPMGLLPWWDAKISADEARRIKKLGLRGVNMNPDPESAGVPDIGDRYWDPLWEVCSDLSLPVNFHIGAGEEAFKDATTGNWASLNDSKKIALSGVTLFLGNARVLAHLLISGLLERYPKLKFVSVESGIGWIPFLLQALDYQVEGAGPKAFSNLSMKPSEYFRRQVYSCFWFERTDLAKLVRDVGVDNVMFETDYPHPACLHPAPLDYCADALASLDLASQRKIMGENAAKLYSVAI